MPHKPTQIHLLKKHLFTRKAVRHAFLITTSTLMLASCANMGVDESEIIDPEIATGIEHKVLVKTKQHMVVAANPLAARAGNDILKAGGSATDAAIAVQLVLALVEPQSSGLGGGAFAIHYDAENKTLTTLDGRETAPLAATPTLFQNKSGEPLSFYDAVVGGRSVGTPGLVKLLETMHQRYGTLPWKDLFAPAITLAEQGFAVSPRLARQVAQDQDRLKRYPGTRAYFFDSTGNPLPADTLLTNPELATVLKRVAQHGSEAFYEGDIAQAIVNTVQNAQGNPGVLSLRDFDSYRIKERKPVCSAYRQYSICGMGPPSSGAVTVGQVLGMLEPYDLASLGPDSVKAWRLYADASRLAFADRARYLADSDYVPVPLAGLLDQEYLKQRAELLNGSTALKQVVAGAPTWRYAMLQADDQSIELPSTTHMSIVDAQGNVVSMTSTIENGFGSRLMVKGFLLNNELTDFSFASHNKGIPIANRVEPGKRPRSSMSPTIVLNEANEPYMVIGSPGGSRIISYVTKTLIAHLDWGMNIQEAISLPNRLNHDGTYELEKGTSAEALAPQLKKLGYKVSIRDQNSGLSGIVITDEGLEGGADPRREGLAIGF